MTDKRFPPTEKRIGKALRDGQVRHSQPATSLATALAMGLALLFTSSIHLPVLGREFYVSVDWAAPRLEHLQGALSIAFRAGIQILLPALCAGALAAVLSGLAQAKGASFFRRRKTGLTWESPFSATRWQSVALSLALWTLALLSAIVLLASTGLWHPAPSSAIGPSLTRWLRGTAGYVIGACTLAVMIDLLWQRHLFLSSLWMSLEERQQEERDERPPETARTHRHTPSAAQEGPVQTAKGATGGSAQSQ